MKKILIIGAGQIGTRYLEGILKSNMSLEVIIVDIKEESLENCQREISKIKKTQGNKKLSFYKNINSIYENIKKIDIAIISTTAQDRAKIVKKISANLEVDYWILEKVLAQNSIELKKIAAYTKNAKNAWVNTPRRSFEFYQLIKAKINKLTGLPINMKLTGEEWGLACNSIHFVDLFCWMNTSPLKNIKTENLEKIWTPAKRVQNFEIFGSIEIYLKNGSHGELSCSPGPIKNKKEYKIYFYNNDFECRIIEEQGFAHFSDAELISGEIPLHSNFTITLVEEIINNGKCGLTKLQESISQHTILLTNLLSHWNSNREIKFKRLPIT